MSKKLKIAIIGSRGYPYVYSGYETLVKELSERLVRSGHEVTVYCHKKLFNEKPKKVNGVNLIYTPSLNSKIFSQIYNSFFSFIHFSFSKNDLVLVVNSANGPFGLLMKLFRKKTCINVDGLEWLRPKWKGFGSIYFRIASRFATLFYDKIITDSYEMEKVYKEKFNKDSVVISYGPTMKNIESVDTLERFNLIPSEYYLIVGRLIPDNNSKLIIEGYLKSNSCKKIVIVGDVPYKDSYAIKVKSLMSERVVFTGYIKNQDILSCLYKNCFAYVHGHEFGGTNPTMINALFFNCSIIALKTKFNIEMLEKKESIYFEKNSMSISNAFKIFENNYQKILKSNLKYCIKEEYQWDYIFEKYEEIFKDLTGH